MWLVYFPVTWTTLLEVGSEKCTTIMSARGRGGKDEDYPHCSCVQLPEHSSKQSLHLALLVGENFP